MGIEKAAAVLWRGELPPISRLAVRACFLPVIGAGIALGVHATKAAVILYDCSRLWNWHQRLVHTVRKLSDPQKWQ
jgi:hypothetical protein